MGKRKYSAEQERSIKKFSYAFALLKLLTLMLFFAGVLFIATEMGFISLTQALVMGIIALAACYLLLHWFASQTSKAIMEIKWKKAQRVK